MIKGSKGPRRGAGRPGPHTSASSSDQLVLIPGDQVSPRLQTRLNVDVGCFWPLRASRGPLKTLWSAHSLLEAKPSTKRSGLYQSWLLWYMALLIPTIQLPLSRTGGMGRWGHAYACMRARVSVPSQVYMDINR